LLILTLSLDFTSDRPLELSEIESILITGLNYSFGRSG